jgi:hypothetical protein
MQCSYELTSLRWGTPKRVLGEEEGALGMSEEEEEEPSVGIEEEEEEPQPTSPPSHASQRWEEEWCGCYWSFPPRGTREIERSC